MIKVIVEKVSLIQDKISYVKENRRKEHTERLKKKYNWLYDFEEEYV